MEKIWLSSYQEGVRAEVNVREYQSIIDVFHQSAQKYAQRTAFINMNQHLSFSELKQKAEQFASFLQNHLKLPRGERVAIMLPNLLQYPVALQI